MSPRLPRVTSAEVLRVLHRAGWFDSRQSGAHVILHHPTQAGRIVVAVHRGKQLKPTTVHSILEDAGITVDEFRRLL